MEQIYQQDVRNQNLRRVYDEITGRENASRALIADELSLSRPALSSIVDELIQDRLVIEAGYVKDRTAAGRNPVRLKTATGNKFVAVMEWRDGCIVGRLADVANVRAGRHREMMYAVKNPADYAQRTVACYEKIAEGLSDGQALLGCSIVIPGIINERHGTILSFPCGITEEIGSGLIRELGNSGISSVNLVNDTAMMAYAEIQAESALQQQNMFYINFAMGIGGILYIQGRPFGTATGMQTQLGSMTILQDEEAQSVHLEDTIGESAVKRRLRESLPELEDRPLGEGYYYQVLHDETQRGNAAAIQIMESMTDVLARAVCNVVTVMVPDCLILGGDGVCLGDEFLTSLQDKIRRYSVEYLIRDLEIRYSALDRRVVMDAAAGYAFHRHYNFGSKNMDGFYIG